MYVYTTLIPYNLLPYNHNTYNAIPCDMRVYGHVLGIVASGHDVVVYDMYMICINVVYNYVDCI